MFRRIVCCLLVCCLLFCMFSTIKVKASALAWGLGTEVGVEIIGAIGAMLTALGVSPGTSSDDFWDIVNDIARSLPDSMKLGISAGGIAAQTMLKGWLYQGSYYFRQEVMDAVNSYIFAGTESYSATTGTVVTTAPVSKSKTFENAFASAFDKAMGHLYSNYPEVYAFAKASPYTLQIRFTDGSRRYYWSDHEITWSINSAGNYEFVTYPDWVIHTMFVSASDVYTYTNGFAIVDDALQGNIASVSSGVVSYKSNRDVNLSNLAEKVDSTTYAHLTVIEGGQDPDTGEDNDPIPYFPVSLPSSTKEVETLTQEEAQSGSISEPSISVEVETGEVVETNGDVVYLIAGQDVGVDVETAVASILVSLGISPGNSNSDFRQLVADVVASLASDMVFDAEFVMYGDVKLLKAWLYDGDYYFSQEIMDYINNLLYSGSSTMDPAFGSGDFNVDKTVFSYYDYAVSTMKSYSVSYVGTILEDSTYLCAISNSYDNSQFFIFSKSPIVASGDGYVQFIVSDDYSWSGKVTSSSCSPDYGNVTSGSTKTVAQVYINYLKYEMYEKSVFPLIDITLSDYSQILFDLDYSALNVSIEGSDLTYYPIKLFPSLDKTEAATQTEIQTDYTSSIPNISVDIDTGEIIEVNRPTIIEEPDPTTAPEVDPDPTTTPEVDPDPTTAPEVDPDIGTGSDPDTGTDSDTDTGTGTEGDSDSLSENSLWEILKRFGEFLLELFWTPFRWLGNMLLEGIKLIFVPQEDFLTAKVEALCEEFAFAQSIVKTAQLINSDLAGITTEPPVIYIDLGASRGSYYLGSEVPFIDLRWYSEYKPTVDALLSALLWIVFCWRVFVKLPGIIGGLPGDFVMDGLTRLGLSDSLPSRKIEYEVQRQSNRRPK